MRGTKKFSLSALRKDSLQAGAEADQSANDAAESELDRTVTTMLTKTARFLKSDLDNFSPELQRAQLLLTEYMAMLADAQQENRRLRALLGDYGDSTYADRGLPASTVVSKLARRNRKLKEMVHNLRAALEKIHACEKEATKRKQNKILSVALKQSEEYSTRRKAKP